MSSPGSQLDWRVAELEKDVGKLEALPTEVALLVASVKSLESRFRNLQRGFYFFGGCVVTASIGFGVTALRVFGNSTPSTSTLVDHALRAVGLS